MNDSTLYIQSILMLHQRMNAPGLALDFWKWKRELCKEVQVRSYKENPELKEMVEEFLKRDKVKLKECFYTAYRLSLMFPDKIQYVDGYAVGIIPIEHGWNVYGEDFYFDLTSELLHDGTFSDYTQIQRYNYKELLRYSLKYGHSGGYIYDIFRSRCENLQATVNG